MDKMETRELMSALADGQLRGDAFARAVDAASADAAARAAWQEYHLIGDVLRSQELAVARDPAAFAAGVRQRLAQEPRPVAVTVQVATPDPLRQREPANDANFRWKLVAGFASFAAVAAVGWTGVAALRGVPDAQQLARAQTPPAQAVVTGDPRGAMIRDPQLDELLAAHRQFGGTSALQMPASFLRNAAFEAPAR